MVVKCEIRKIYLTSQAITISHRWVSEIVTAGLRLYWNLGFTPSSSSDCDFYDLIFGSRWLNWIICCYFWFQLHDWWKIRLARLATSDLSRTMACASRHSACSSPYLAIKSLRSFIIWYPLVNLRLFHRCCFELSFLLGFSLFLI